MTWFTVALIAPFLWSLLNHLDKYLLSKYAKESGVGGLMVYSSMFAIFALPVAAFFSPSVFAVTGIEKTFLIITGLFYTIAILFYLYALERDDASFVIPFWQLVPIFAYIQGILFLGETIEQIKVIGSIITIIGAVILSIEFEEKKKIKGTVVLLMVASSVFLALSDVIYKLFAEHTEFWASIFWNQIGMTSFGIFCILFVKTYRKDFLSLTDVKKKGVLALNLSGEAIQTIALGFNYYSTLLAPIALVLLISYTFQPFLVFIEGVLLSLLLPSIIKEKLEKKHLAQKLLSIIIMVIGVYLVIS